MTRKDLLEMALMAMKYYYMHTAGKKYYDRCLTMAAGIEEMERLIKNIK